MTITESKDLKKGPRVYWRGDAGDNGTIIDTSWSAVTIRWNNGTVASVHHGDMRKSSGRRQIRSCKVMSRPLSAVFWSMSGFIRTSHLGSCDLESPNDLTKGAY